MNANLLTLKNVTKGFSDLMYQVLRAMKFFSPYMVLDPEQSCVFLKLKKRTPPIFSRLRSKI